MDRQTKEHIDQDTYLIINCANKKGISTTDVIKLIREKTYRSILSKEKE